MAKDTSQTPEELLAEIKETCMELYKVLENNFENGFIHQAIKQHLTGAANGVDQILRNIRLEAELADKKAKGILS